MFNLHLPWRKSLMIASVEIVMPGVRRVKLLGLKGGFRFGATFVLNR
jgi:hypothetical protein